MITPANLVKACQALVVNLTDPAKPVWPETQEGKANSIG